ncbi:MAG: hypothetical protein ACLUI3_14485 [Christensenellales bacterium]
MIVDRDEAVVTADDEATSAQIADCTDENVARALGVKILPRLSASGLTSPAAC